MWLGFMLFALGGYCLGRVHAVVCTVLAELREEVELH